MNDCNLPNCNLPKHMFSAHFLVFPVLTCFNQHLDVGQRWSSWRNRFQFPGHEFFTSALATRPLFRAVSLSARIARAVISVAAELWPLNAIMAWKKMENFPLNWIVWLYTLWCHQTWPWKMDHLSVIVLSTPPFKYPCIGEFPSS